MFACIHSRAAQLSLPGVPDPRQPLLVECAYSFSPRIEEAAPGTVIADLEGCSHLFGSDEQVAEKIAQRAAELGLEVSVAVGANPDVAACAARALPGVTVIPAGREAEALAGLPVETLTAHGPLAIRNPQSEIRNSPPAKHSFEQQEILETLNAWGIRSLGELAALPAAGLSERLGPAGLRLRELARGASTRALVPSVPVPGFEKSIELEYSVALIEPLMFVVASLLNQLCRNLEERALATNEITVRLKLEAEGDRQTRMSAGTRQAGMPASTPAGNVYERVLRLPVPMRNNQAFLRLVQLDLEQHPPQAPVVGVWLRTRPVKPRALQDGLFVPLAPEPQKLELTLARISKLVGKENCGAAELLDTHRPDAFRINRFEVRGARFEGKKSRYEVRGARFEGKEAGTRTSNLEPRTFPTSHLEPRISLGFRHYRPPLAAQVETVREQPARVAARGVRGKVVSLAGPWRTAGDWWSLEPWDRDEWDVGLAGGELYRIYFDRRQRGWFIDGTYD